FETNIARQISEAVRTPEYKAEIKRQEEKREEVKEEVRQQVEKMQADKRNRLSELDQKTVQFLQLVRDHNPKLADKIEINEDPAILEKIRTQMRAKKSIGFLQKGYRFFGALGLKEQFILPPGMLKIEARDKTYTVSLTPQEKALLGVIFSPEKAKTHRLKIFEKATAEAHNRGNNKPPSIRRP